MTLTPKKVQAPVYFGSFAMIPERSDMPVEEKNHPSPPSTDRFHLFVRMCLNITTSHLTDCLLHCEEFLDISLRVGRNVTLFFI